MKKIVLNSIKVLALIVVIYLLSQVDYRVNEPKNGGILGHSSFIDDSGNLINVQDSKSIVSLSSIHTENLYYLGAGEKLSGVDEDSIFPFEAVGLPHYRLNKVHDVASLISRKPDYVLIDDSVSNKYRSVVSELESAGLVVVDLSPKNIEEFNVYITKLGVLTGLTTMAKELLVKFNSELEVATHDGIGSLYEKPSNITKPSYVTLFDYAGVYLIDKSFNAVGIEAVLEKPDDPYFYYITRYTFRLASGIAEIDRLLGTRGFLEGYSDAPLTRGLFSKILYSELRLPTYTVTKHSYYEFEKYFHTYGKLTDIPFNSENFSIYETVIWFGYLKPVKSDQGDEFFNSNDLITKADLKHFLLIYNNMETKESDKFLKHFNRPYTGADLIEIVTTLKESL